MKIKFLTSLLAAGVVAGCATLQKGADPLVVRAEQTEAIAKATFDTFVRIDDANRGFFKTNAPAVHRFAEWLREPVFVSFPPEPAKAGPPLPRGLAFVRSLDTVKLAYKANHSLSNDVVTALATVESAVIQAQQYISQSSPTTIHPQ